MPCIRIQNIGPIKDSGILDLARITIFIGQQSTGKSTIMKILCFCCWVEKYCVTHNDDKWFSSYQHFFKNLKSFHHFVDSLFIERQSRITYIGDWIDIDFTYKENNNNAQITRKNWDQSQNTKLCFIPSERNLMATVRNVDSAYKVKSIDNIFNYILEWDSVKRSYNKEHALTMPFLNGLQFFYDSKNDKEVLKLQSGKEFTPYYASSGVQSSYSLYVMVDYLTGKVFDHNASLSRDDINRLVLEILNEQNITSESQLVESKSAIENRVDRRRQYKGSKIFIEEPEQNLFPTAQVDLLFHIVERVNKANDNNKNCSVVLTTHSPYLISALNMLLLGGEYMTQINNNHRPCVDSLRKVQNVFINSEWLQCYLVNENGTVGSILSSTDGVTAIEAVSTLDGVSDMLEDLSDQINDLLIYSDDN